MVDDTGPVLFHESGLKTIKAVPACLFRSTRRAIYPSDDSQTSLPTSCAVCNRSWNTRIVSSVFSPHQPWSG